MRSWLTERRRQILAVPCPYCGQPAGQRCIVKRSKTHRLVPPDYYGPDNFHAARRKSAPVEGGAQ